jgi:hypothetical protein
MTSAFIQPSIADIAEDKLVERLFADPLWGTEFFELAPRHPPLDGAPGKFKGDIDVLRCAPDHPDQNLTRPARMFAELTMVSYFFGSALAGRRPCDAGISATPKLLRKKYCMTMKSSAASRSSPSRFATSSICDRMAFA